MLRNSLVELRLNQAYIIDKPLAANPGRATSSRIARLSKDPPFLLTNTL
jgi:hypothetical protein